VFFKRHTKMLEEALGLLRQLTRMGGKIMATLDDIRVQVARNASGKAPIQKSTFDA